MAKHITLMTFLFSVGILFQGCDSDIKCKDDNGNEVDWYILYKLPEGNGDGLWYLYMDKSTDGWKLSKEIINSTSGALANTLRPLLDYYVMQYEDFGYILYNDQPLYQKSASSSYGQSKGVVMLNRQTGVWLSHSTPSFPTYQSQDFWPDNGRFNAQTFMCVTYSYEQFKDIGVQLMYIHPFPYDYFLPTTFHKELKCVIEQNCYPTNAPWFNLKMLTSIKGSDFFGFAKYTHFGDDLYSGLIVNYLKQVLFVKSWGQMPDPLPSNCSSSIPASVYNVKDVKLNEEACKDTKDHSKWCITVDSGWTCIADVDRGVSQMNRGGGAICTSDVQVWKAFWSLITWTEACTEGSRSDAQHREL